MDIKLTVKKLPKSEVEIEGELATDVFEGYFEKALKHIGANLELPGFRKGKAPENVIISKVGEPAILQEMAEMALAEHYPKILESEKIDAISQPKVAITKLARKNPLGFKITTAVLPEIKLPDYKTIAKKITSEKKEEVDVSDEEVEKTILDIRKSRAPKKDIKEKAKEDAKHEHKEGEAHDHKHEESKESVKSDAIQSDEDLPPFDDEFVKALGPFKDVADFTTKLKDNIKLEKENQQKEKTRLKIIEEVIEKSSLEVPEILIEVEIDKIIYRMESDIVQMGLKFEDYLKHLNKTKEDLRKDFRVDAEKKAKLGLLLNEIAKVEKITADPKFVEKEVEHILEHYKDADPERAKMHAENVLTNEKIFQFLENQGSNK